MSNIAQKIKCLYSWLNTSSLYENYNSVSTTAYSFLWQDMIWNTSTRMLRYEKISEPQVDFEPAITLRRCFVCHIVQHLLLQDELSLWKEIISSQSSTTVLFMKNTAEWDYFIRTVPHWIRLGAIMKTQVRRMNSLWTIYSNSREGEAHSVNRINFGNNFVLAYQWKDVMKRRSRFLNEFDWIGL